MIHICNKSLSSLTKNSNQINKANLNIVLK